ncbi:hypothetical protein PVAND_015979 [Polypedilum vanderplanki]|uniref:Curlin associated repeat-containing protein n=1 Tax=Polypedilum vanderplanki TaxID=319348 RepID=A0A9J6BET2_POLVA|nr:hypothetical protein PVAND_015979 [Polypedilum vanderplanki]
MKFYLCFLFITLFVTIQAFPQTSIDTRGTQINRGSANNIQKNTIKMNEVEAKQINEDSTGVNFQLSNFTQNGVAKQENKNSFSAQIQQFLNGGKGVQVNERGIGMQDNYFIKGGEAVQINKNSDNSVMNNNMIEGGKAIQENHGTGCNTVNNVFGKNGGYLEVSNKNGKGCNTVNVNQGCVLSIDIKTGKVSNICY